MTLGNEVSEITSSTTPVTDFTNSSILSYKEVTSIITQDIIKNDAKGNSSIMVILSAIAAVLIFVVVFGTALFLGCIMRKKRKYNLTEQHADVREQSKGEHDHDYTELTSSNMDANSTYITIDECNQLQTLTPNLCLLHKQNTNLSSLTAYPKYEPSNLEDSIDDDSEPVYAPLYDVLSSNEINVPLFKPENIKLLRTLGMGYFGKVLLAEAVNINLEDFNFAANMSSTTKVAVKKLKASCSTSIKLAFHKELKFMSRLQHENLVRVLGACLQAETFIVMEYMKNGDLNGFLQNYEDISLADDPTTDLIINIHILIKMSSQIANGMKYLSSKNYIHRDLAARNILVGEEFKVKISDFGMSRNLYTSHYYIMQGRTAVPIRWMARECFSGKFSTETDVWAFGVTMWEIFTLAKCIPYEEMSNEEVAEDALKKHRTLPEIPNKCPLEVYDVMLTCWRDTAQDRASFDAVYDMLSSLTCSLSK